MRRNMLAAFVAALLFGLPTGLYSTPCTSDDVGEFNSTCENGARHVYSFWKTDCDYSANSSVKIPPPRSMICDCAPGMGLLNNVCQPCNPGTFSGDGSIIDDWKDWGRTGIAGEHLGFVTHCEMENSYYSQKKTCSPWTEEGYGAYLTSGNQSRASTARSILVLDKEFVEEKSFIIFRFRVDAECSYWYCSSLEFYIDGDLIMPSVSQQLTWKEFRTSITQGHHRLLWSFYQHEFSSDSNVEQKAYIQSVTLIGTSAENTDCHNCPVGSTSSKGAHVCDPCGDFTYQNQSGQPNCLQCPNGTYSLGGATSCIPKPICTADDIVVTIDSVITCYNDSSGVMKRKMQQKYLTPFTLNETLCNDSNQQQLNVSSLYKCFCQPGYEFVQSQSPICRPCLEGSASSTGVTCEICPAGTEAVPGLFYYEWNMDTMKEFMSLCAGDCDSDGWIASGDHVRTGRAVGTTDSYLTLKNITFPEGGTVEFNCSVDCHISTHTGNSSSADIARFNDCHLYFEMTQNTGVKRYSCGNDYEYWWDYGYRDGRIYNHHFSVSPGNYSFTWKFHQQDPVRRNVEFEAKVSAISLVGTAGGSARDCTPCSPGYRSVDGASRCIPCPPGSYSSGGTDKCHPCEGNSFASVAGSATCKKCGEMTTVNSDHTGCNVNDCTVSFNIAENMEVQYNLSLLQRFNDSMIAAKVDDSYYLNYFINPCTVVHDNSSCSIDGKPVATMACQQECWSGYGCWSVYSLGDTIGFEKAEDVQNGLILKFSYGSTCSRNDLKTEATVHMICDEYAGVGQPERYGNNSFIEIDSCRYVFEWRSRYACPVCRKEYYQPVYGDCQFDGTREKHFMKTQACWGGDFPKNVTVSCQTYQNCTKHDFRLIYGTCLANGTRTKYYVPVSLCQDGYQPPEAEVEACSTGSHGHSDKTVPILVGVGVTLIILLIAIVIFFYYRNRRLRYQYYTALGSTRPLEKLGIVDDTDDDADTFHFSPSSDNNGENPFSSDI